MNTIEDRIRAAAHAAADSVPPDGVPPLRLTPQDPAEATRRRPSRRPRSRSSWAPWLAPAAAAVAVVLVVVAVVSVGRSVHASRTGTSSRTSAAGQMIPGPSIASYVSSGQIPTLYVVPTPLTNATVSPHYAIVRATVSGQVLATIRPSLPGDTIMAVSAAADDRTFVLDEQPMLKTDVAHQDVQPRTFYLLQLTSAGQVSTLRRLPMSVPAEMVLTGLSLSPDGSKLATAVEHDNAQGLTSPTTVTVYTLSSGAERTWTGDGTMGDSDDTRSLSWTSGERTLAFNWWGSGRRPALEVRLLNLAADGSDLTADSRLIVSWWNPAAHPGKTFQQVLPPSPSSPDTTIPLIPDGDAVITPDGSAVACGAVRMIETSGASQPHIEQGMFEVSTVTGQITRILGQWQNTSEVYDEVLWSNPSGQVLIGVTSRLGIGVLNRNEFTPMKTPTAPYPANQGAW